MIDLDKTRRELSDKCSLNELLELKNKLMTQLECKVELKEVQQALNDCQTDLCDQLSDFKKTVKSDIHAVEGEFYKVIERKANVVDVQDALSAKLDSADQDLFARKSEMNEALIATDRIAEEVKRKIDAKNFDEIDFTVKRRFEDQQQMILQKSNIKDVCALLDMKANIDDVNTAL